MSCYEEFAGLPDIASELRLEVPKESPKRSMVTVEGRTLSGISWGGAKPEIVFLHGGGQNAHTWDATILALGLPSLALDLPGHGHSSWRDEGYDPIAVAEDVSVALEILVPEPVPVVEMSFGGLIGVVMAARFPDRVPALAMVDITPAVTPERAGPLVESITRAASMATEEDLVGFLSAAMPGRSVDSIRRSVGHSIVRTAQGWRWRYDPRIMDHAATYDASPIWDLLGAVRCPVSLILGERSRAVEEADVAEFRRRLPTADVIVVEGAGHSVQSDKLRELAALLA